MNSIGKLVVMADTASRALRVHHYLLPSYLDNNGEISPAGGITCFLPSGLKILESFATLAHFPPVPVIPAWPHDLHNAPVQ